MKKLLFAPALMLSILSCQNTSEKVETVQEEIIETAPAQMAYFGSQITEENAVDLSTIQASLGEQDSLNVKLTGTIEKVCQVKGCWMTMPYGEGESMRVSFRDYGFFVPKDVDG